MQHTNTLVACAIFLVSALGAPVWPSGCGDGSSAAAFVSLSDGPLLGPLSSSVYKLPDYTGARHTGTSLVYDDAAAFFLSGPRVRVVVLRRQAQAAHP